MSYAVPEIAFAALSVLVGWCALWPLRHGLGSIGYHLAALPVGLIAWPVAAAVGSLFGRPFDWLTALTGAVLFILSSATVAWLTNGRLGVSPSGSSSARLRGFVAAGALLLGGSLALGLSRASTTSGDAYRAFWPLGVDLTLHGSLGVYLVSSRSIFIPAMNAMHLVVGSDWAYVIYPLLTASVLMLLLFVILEGPLRRVSKAWKVTGVLGVLAFLVSDPTFLYHAFYTHSHMISALYLLLSLGALWRATARLSVNENHSANAWLVVAGIAAAGLALVRPDGLAYVFVPVALALSVLSRDGYDSRAAAAYFAPLLALVYLVYLAAFIELGMWSAGKLDGAVALGILVLLAFVWAVPAVMSAIRKRRPGMFGSDRVLPAIVVAAWSLVALAALVRWETVSLAWTHAAMNLFGGHGAWGWAWYSIAGVLVLSVFSGDALRKEAWTRSLFLSIMLFFAVAAVVHGVSHPGRLGANDSFNRVAFHLVPVVLWYSSCILGRILETERGSSRWSSRW